MTALLILALAAVWACVLVAVLAEVGEERRVAADLFVAAMREADREEGRKPWTS